MNEHTKADMRLMSALYDIDMAGTIDAAVDPAQDTPEPSPVWHCIWCCKDTKTNPCEHCESTSVFDKTKPHNPHWSRRTMNTWECKICGRVVKEADADQDVLNTQCVPVINKG